MGYSKVNKVGLKHLLVWSVMESSTCPAKFSKVSVRNKYKWVYAKEVNLGVTSNII